MNITLTPSAYVPTRAHPHDAGHQTFHVNPGDRIAQLVVVPIMKPEVVVVDSLDDTARGDGGFGSTGRG